MESQKALLAFLGRESDVKHGKGNKMNPGKKPSSEQLLMSLLGLIVTSCDLAVKSQFFSDADSNTCRDQFALDLTTLR